MAPHELKDEIDFGDLRKHPEKLFGYGFLYFLGLLCVLGMLYLWNINAVGANAVMPVALKDSSAFALDIPLQSPMTLPPVDVMKAGVASDSMVARGRDLYRANCVSCHGDAGGGDGASAATLNPKPRDFRSLSGWTNGSLVSQIYKTLEEGIVRNGMASYNYFPPADRFALAHFVRTFAAGQPLDSPENLQQLEVTYQLSAGRVVPGQIPIKKAAALVLKEGDPGKARLETLVADVSKDTRDGARLLRSMSMDLRRTITAAERHPFANASDFVRAASADPEVFGYRARVARLTKDEWGGLYSYLQGIVQRKD